METKKFIINVTVDNTGCDFGDDEYEIALTVPSNVTKSMVSSALKRADKKLSKYGKNVAYNLYDEYGHNADTLLIEVCEKHPDWSFEYFNPDVSITIC